VIDDAELRENGKYTCECSGQGCTSCSFGEHCESNQCLENSNEEDTVFGK